MGVYNTMQSVLFVGGATGGLLFQNTVLQAYLPFCSVLMLLWLVLAVISPAPKPVKTSAIRLTPNGNKSDLLYQN